MTDERPLSRQEIIQLIQRESPLTEEKVKLIVYETSSRAVKETLENLGFDTENIRDSRHDLIWLRNRRENFYDEETQKDKEFVRRQRVSAEKMAETIRKAGTTTVVITLVSGFIGAIVAMFRG